MFGSLKKRLKEAVEKVSKSISEEKEQAEPKPAEITKPDIEVISELKVVAESVQKEKVQWEQERAEEKLTSKEEAEIVVPSLPEPKSEEVKASKPVPKPEAAPAPKPSLADLIEEASIDTQLQKKIEELKEIKEKAIEERLSPEIAESIVETKEAAKEEKEKQGFSFLRKITEKKLSDSDIEKILKELHIALLENDVAVEVAERITDGVKRQLSGSSVKRGKVEDTIRDALSAAMLDVMKQEKIDIHKKIESKDGPFMIMMVGFNGVGKTTTLAKLASNLKQYSPVLAAADTFRAASIEQLEEHGRRLGMRVVKHTYGADAAAVIFDAKKHAAAAGSKLVLADTAGRSHSNVNLMDELKKVARVNQPDMKILVLDSVTGNDIYDQCRLFNDAVGVDAIILTKADVYERGGSALSAAYTLKKPILYIGVGQEYTDLKEFKPDEIVKNLLG